MRYTILLATALLGLTFASCKQKKEAAKAESGQAGTAENLDEIAAAATQLSDAADSLSQAAADAKAAGDSLVISFAKTPCFGQCPVYKVHVYQSGFATYEGINFVDRMGLFEARIPESEMKGLFDLAESAGFFGFERTYDFPGIQDLPSTTLMMDGEGKRNHVMIRYEVPRNVREFFEKVAQRLDRQSWKVSQTK